MSTTGLPPDPTLSYTPVALGLSGRKAWTGGAPSWLRVARGPVLVARRPLIARSTRLLTGTRPPLLVPDDLLDPDTQASLPPPCSPLAPSGFSVPAEQRRRRDEESSPPVPREEPPQGGQEGAVSWPVLDAAMELALEDAHLVAEHDQLDVLVRFAAPERGHERQEPAEAEVDEGEGHVRC